MNRTKITIIALAFGCIFATCKGVEVIESVKEGDYFLLLKDEKTISINIFEENKIKEIQTFPINEKSIFATDQKRRVAIFDRTNNTVILYDIGSSMKSKLSFPFYLEPKCILLNNENLFIGGVWHREKGKTGYLGNVMLVQYHLQNDEWYPLEIPEHIFGGTIRKSIDDLIVNDSMLIAVDNIAMPKYILFYHLNPTGKLVFSHSKELPIYRVAESIHQARITPKYFGLKSISWIGGDTRATFEHITMYNNLDFSGSFVITVKREKVDRQVVFENYQFFNDFLIVENKLFIANKQQGLGILDIKESYFYEKCSETIYFGTFPINEDKISYKQFDNEEIIRLTKIPNEQKIVLTIKNSLGEIRHEVIEVQCRTSYF